METNGKVTSRVELWSVTKATKQLEQNIENRPLSSAWVKELASARAGE